MLSGSRNSYLRAIACIGVSLLALIRAAAAAGNPSCDSTSAALYARMNQRWAVLRQTGDCSLIPGIMAVVHQHMAYGAAHCPNWVREKNDAQIIAILRRSCRAQPTPKAQTAKRDDAAASGGPPKPSASNGGSSSCPPLGPGSRAVPECSGGGRAPSCCE
jgi:hypothetical protein